MSYADTQSRAAALIADKGQAVTLTRHSAAAYDTATATVATLDEPTTTTGVVLPLARGFVHAANSNIRVGDQQLLLPGDIDAPQVNDTVTIGGFTASIVEVSPLSPAGTVLMYDCVIRGTVSPGPAPANAALPAISGSAIVGQQLSVSDGSWHHSPTAYAYQWRRDGAEISGATASAYTLTSADGGSSIDCVVTATNASGSGSAAADDVGPILQPPVNTALPVISGTVQLGATLTVSDGTWTESPTSYAYQWKRDGVAIGGATSSTYVIVAADAETNISCTVTASNADGDTSATSAEVGPVPWTLGVLFAASEAGAVYDISDLSKVWQDSARTVPGVVGQPVGCVDDLSPNVKHALQATTAAKPILRQDAGGRYYLEGDGVDDTMASAATVAFNSPSYMAMGFATAGDTASANGFATMGGWVNTTRRFVLAIRSSTAGQYQLQSLYRYNGGVPSSASFVANDWRNVRSFLESEQSAANITVYGATATGQTSSSSSSNDSLATAPDSLPLTIFGEPASGFPRHFYGGVVILRALSAAERAKARTATAALAGVSA